MAEDRYRRFGSDARPEASCLNDCAGIARSLLEEDMRRDDDGGGHKTGHSQGDAAHGSFERSHLKCLGGADGMRAGTDLSLIHISEPTRH